MMFAETMPGLADIGGLLVISMAFCGIGVVLFFIGEMVFNVVLNGRKITIAGIIALTICVALLCAVYSYSQ